MNSPIITKKTARQKATTKPLSTSINSSNSRPAQRVRQEGGGRQGVTALPQGACGRHVVRSVPSAHRVAVHTLCTHGSPRHACPAPTAQSGARARRAPRPPRSTLCAPPAAMVRIMMREVELQRRTRRQPHRRAPRDRHEERARVAIDECPHADHHNLEEELGEGAARGGGVAGEEGGDERGGPRPVVREARREPEDGPADDHREAREREEEERRAAKRLLHARILGDLVVLRAEAGGEDDAEEHERRAEPVDARQPLAHAHHAAPVREQRREDNG
eukprot:4616153-Prymnesium_polylepis.1